MTRAEFLRLLAGGLGGALLAGLPRGVDAATADYDFWFTRLKYDSGDWDVDQRMPSNVITALIDYTNLRVDPKEHVVALADPAMLSAPFCYLAGHKLVEFNPAERRNFENYVRNGGFVLVDDCNHDIDGLFAKSFEQQMATIFGNTALKKLSNQHPLYRSFFKFADGPPATGMELNGWGDDLVHDYLKGIDIDGRLGVLYSNKDYGCEWDYDWRNKRFLAEDNTRFAVNIVMYALNA
ncbi:DUF4159 domain-containing protein [Pseudoxanthomonas dokdonensis]|uniref:Twin-arginine translocation pathway signal n=1 Tax=Pseudoxanthomonas dokdonensis TaxID=344882 RepID=A0A0R0D3W8_9GAMM|nr:DUF4159 domain-containing protein [Pseudoxanthomonas dokdonensis]KRG72024.1 twin-arginine translocation pathway signal [Pseudoxanthomonas dokdonensis]